MKISCSFCGKKIEATEYDYAMQIRGTLIYCEKCAEAFKNNISQTRKI